MSDQLAEELKQRLLALLEDARKAGVLSELRPLLEDLLAESDRAAEADAGEARSTDLVADDGSAIPSRFGMIGASRAMKEVFALLEKVVNSEVAVLVQGETGTGKELVARALHDFGSRKDKPFLAENCAAVPAELLESELFGHKRGSFTGAFADRAGHFVAAHGGTVFLDEIGDMPVAMQAKLLRVLQEGEVRPVGSNKVTKVDVRIVAASNKDLAAMCREGSFREDLYFRLNVITIRLPALRERKGDVAHLVRHFARSIGAEMGRAVVVRADALEALSRWRWPGNVRELENEIMRSVALSDGRIGLSDLSPAIRAGA